ncbi:xanthine dehydrogenase accessory factor [Pseudarthrobacter defluvii]|uniref:XdhC family protein n=1 Tax=Pseudarthrobacter defluvii TaxID=410837 RepID=UPI002789C87D|nr:XdhC/CoxI family protein [Pseudarthrobacter defluvii]MDQ0767688.1 xanthine dehydrogenase accessory factor [Pseudarthrobacter defluvii]
MLDLIPSLGPWVPRLATRQFAVVTIVSASGSVPRPVGTSMLVAASGDVLGSLSGGCVEGAVVALALEAMDDGVPRHGTFGFSSTDAFAAGLTCGGELGIHVQPVPATGPDATPHPLRTALLQLAESGPDRPIALVRLLGTRGGAAVVLSDPGAFRLAASPQLAALLHGEPALQVESLVRSGGAGLVRLTQPGECARETSGHAQASGEAAILVESRLAPPRMLVFGANDFGAALVLAAKLLGYHVTLVDARPAFASQPRFAAADQVVTDWPHRYLAAEAAEGRTDSRTVAAVLTHDPKFDLPLLEAALALNLAYVGAMGSRRSHLQRVDQLLNAGIAPERIAQLHSPIGLDLGAVTPAEVAVSVTAELIAARTRAATCIPLRETSGTIHHHPAAPRPTDLKKQEIAWT